VRQIDPTYPIITLPVKRIAGIKGHAGPLFSVVTHPHLGVWRIQSGQFFGRTGRIHFFVMTILGFRIRLWASSVK
jgi:hypothetical protein